MRTKEKYLTEHRISNHLSKGEKNMTGSFWTPPEIAFEMASKTKYKKGETVIDLNCGGGSLLAAMLDTYADLEEENLYGLDIDPIAIKICLGLFPNGNFQVGNCLIDPIDNIQFWNKPPFALWEEYKRGL